jgi:arabinose-5-phosphate isomerase
VGSLPSLFWVGNKLISITGNINSFLGKEAHYTLNTFVESESCPNNLAPTNSTTAQLVMGDALAVCLMEMRNFTAEDFGKFHPGGALGKKLLLRVSDMLDFNRKPMVSSESSIKNVIVTISEQRLGVTAVLEDKKVIGIITDGDIRRMLNKTENITGLTAKEIMTSNPKIIKSTDRVADALNIMEDFSITQLIVVDNEEYKGIVHLHDILKEGIV